MKNLISITGMAILFYLFLLSSCTPMFSELQSARTAGQGNWEVTPGFSTVSLTGETSDAKKETEHSHNHVGFQAAYGITDNFDVRLRYEYLWVDDDGGQAHILGVGPKVELLENWVALYVPVGTAFGGDVDNAGDNFQIHPTMLLTAPVNNNFEVNASAKYIIPFQEGMDDLLAFNFGLGLSTNRSSYVLRPEYGLLYNPGEEGHFSQFSVGITFYLPGN